MAQFSRKTVLAATDYLNFEMTHANLTRFLLEYGLEGIADSGSVESRANSIARYLLEDPNRTTDDGLNLTDAVVEDVVRRAISKCTSRDYGFDYERFKERYPYLVRTLEVNGFTVEDGQFRRALPESLDLPAVADELQLLLERRALRTSQGHLNQAIDAHARGHWASANAQVRAFFESLFDEIATLVDPTNGSTTRAGETRRQLLANLPHPFLSRALNEWSDDGKNFVNGVFKRFHPHGAHPGLSDEDDCTFRLHLAFLVSGLFLRRLDRTLEGDC